MAGKQRSCDSSPRTSAPESAFLATLHNMGVMGPITDEEAQAQRDEATCPESHSLEEEELASDPGRPVLAGAPLTPAVHRAWS